MDSQIWQRVQNIVGQAAGLPEADRASFIADACGSDPELRREVDSLLAALDSADSFLEASPLRPPELDEEALPDQIGPYRIERQLGAGGMGVVYLAEQDQPRRLVALKVIPPGILTGRARRRFAREAEILGRLRHPGIAQVFDAGQSGADGYAYIAMEYVSGSTLTRFAETADLTDEARLALLRQVCEAVQYAHQKGVIHRDLKPANILVQAEDGQAPVAKVLDFGIAHLVDDQLDLTRTRSTELAGTPSYMPPEQLRGDTPEADTLGDVYALGVVGFELLSGQLPHEIRGNNLAELIRVVTSEPPRSLGRLRPDLPGDVETILGKALDGEPSNRYASAQSLADDLRRYARNEPIAARPASAVYQLRKFAVRHRALVSGVLLAAVGLVVGAGFAVWQAVEARAAEVVADERRAEAERQTAVANAVREFLNETLGYANPVVAERPDLTLREMLDAAAKRIPDQFAEQPDVGAAVNTAIGDSYHGLGLFDQAEERFRAALELEGQISPYATMPIRLKLGRALQEQGDHAGAEEQARLVLNASRADGLPDALKGLSAQAEIQLSVAAYQLARYDKARAAAERALAWYEANTGPSSPGVAESLDVLAAIALQLAEYETAERNWRDAYRVRVESFGEDDWRVGLSHSDLGRLYRRMGDYARAETELLEALRIARETYGDEHVEVARTQVTLADLLIVVGRYDDARTSLEVAIGILRDRLGTHTDVANALAKIGTTYQEQGYLRGDVKLIEEAIKWFAEAVEIDRAVFGEGHLNTAANLNNLALLQSLLQQSEEAGEALQEVLAILRSGYDGPHPDTAATLNNLAGVRMDQGRLDEAIELQREALEMREVMLGVDHPEVAESHNNLAWIQRLSGAREDALVGFSAALKILDALEQSDRDLHDRVRYNLALTLSELKRWEEAASAWEVCYEARAAYTERGQRGIADVAARWAESLRERGDLEAADPLLEQAAEYCRGEAPSKLYCRYIVRQMIALREAQGRADEVAALEEWLKSFAKESE